MSASSPTTSGAKGDSGPKATTGGAKLARTANLPSEPVPRGASTKELLKLNWDCPVYEATESPRSDNTGVKQKRQALSREDAIHVLAGKDPRPLLVLRECSFCNKTDDALLTPGGDNEKTLFLTRWFHCVKLPVDVIQSDHPFNALFPDNDAEHLFVSAVDGSGKLPLEADTSRVELWAAMGNVLAAAYAKDPTAVYKDVRLALDKLDTLDQRLLDLQGKRAELSEASTPDSSKLKKVDGEIAHATHEIAGRRAEIERLCKIDLKAGSAPSRASAGATR
jgi:hypothetical protein